jgi:hypothetical protein
VSSQSKSWAGRKNAVTSHRFEVRRSIIVLCGAKSPEFVTSSTRLRAALSQVEHDGGAEARKSL